MSSKYYLLFRWTKGPFTAELRAHYRGARIIEEDVTETVGATGNF